MSTTLDMSPVSLLLTAKVLVDVLEQTKHLLPTETVDAAGGDPISDYAARVLTAQGVQLTYLIRQGRHLVDAAARAIGDAAGETSAADASGGKGGAMTDAVGSPPPFEPDSLPAAPTGVLSGEDAKRFAEQIFEQGDQGVSAQRYIDIWNIAYREGAHKRIAVTVDNARPEVQQRWQPAGTQVAKRFSEWLTWYEKVDDQATKLANAAANYADAFDKVKNVHPTPKEIKEANDRLVASSRPGTDPAERDAAIQNWNQVQERAQQAQQQYRAAIESGVRSENVVDLVGPAPAIADQTSAAGRGTPRTRAAGGTGTNETQVGKNQTGDTGEKGATNENNALNELLSGLGQNSQQDDIGAATTDPAAAQQANTTANPASAGGFPGIPPMSNPNAGPNPDDGRTAADLDLDDPLNFDSGPGAGYAGGYGGAPGGGGGVRTPAAGGVTGTSNASAAKTPAAVPQFGMPAARIQQASLGSGMPMYPPYGGMGPGAGANGGERAKNPFEKPKEFVDIDAERAKGLPGHILNEVKVVADATPTPKTADRTSETNQAGATA